MANEESKSEPFFEACAEINEENFLSIKESGALALPLLRGILEKKVLAEFPLKELSVQGNPGSVFYKKWGDLWVEQVIIRCFTDRGRSSGIEFLVRERFFYKSNFMQVPRVSDAQPAEPYFFRLYVPPSNWPDREGIQWNGPSEGVDHHTARFEAAQAILQLLGDVNYANLWRWYFDALDKYLEKYPEEPKFVKAWFHEILHPGAARDKTYEGFKKAPLLLDEIEREFKRRKSRGS